MKSCRAMMRIWLGLLAAIVFSLPAESASISTSEYRRQLQDLNSRVEQLKDHPEAAKQLENDVPDRVTISDGSGEYSLDYHWLKKLVKQFEQADPKTRSAFLERSQDHLKRLDEAAQAYEQSRPASSSDHHKLDEILARREFRKAHGPTWWDILWEKIDRWISDFFQKHPINGSAGTDVLHILVYAAVAVAFSLFAIWIKRRLDRPRQDFTREIIPFAPSAKAWSSWLADARAAAQEGDWRNGVHLAYWAGISFLEEHGAWKPDRARTPREYLRILGTRKPQYPTLSALTRKFEVIWYGRRDAQAADFSEALQQLEKLGCK
jgi:hypothetical protein